MVNTYGGFTIKVEESGIIYIVEVEFILEEKVRRKGIEYSI